MKPGTKAYIAREGGKLLSDLLKVGMTRPKKPPVESPESEKEGISEEVATSTIQPPAEVPQSGSTSVLTREGLDPQTLAYQEDKALGEAYLLEDHLKAGCHECGEASDCCWKHADKLARYTHETMSMTTDPFWQNLRELAVEIRSKTLPGDVKADIYMSEYPTLAVRLSEFRRPLQQKAIARQKPPITLEEAKALAAEEAAKKVEERWQSQEKK